MWLVGTWFGGGSVSHPWWCNIGYCGAAELLGGVSTVGGAAFGEVVANW
jgi:hypothetical protein